MQKKRPLTASDSSDRNPRANKLYWTAMGAPARRGRDRLEFELDSADGAELAVSDGHARQARDLCASSTWCGDE